MAESRAKKRSPCPVAGTLDLVGDRWTLLVVRDLMRGKSTFGELLASPERIATNILSERLRRLTEAGIVEELPPRDARARCSYGLTASGRELHAVLEAIARWGLAHVEGSEARLEIPRP